MSGKTDSVRVAASITILDRTFGRPRQTLQAQNECVDTAATYKIYGRIFDVPRSTCTPQHPFSMLRKIESCFGRNSLSSGMSVLALNGGGVFEDRLVTMVSPTCWDAVFYSHFSKQYRRTPPPMVLWLAFNATTLRSSRYPARLYSAMAAVCSSDVLSSILRTPNRRQWSSAKCSIADATPVR